MLSAGPGCVAAVVSAMMAVTFTGLPSRNSPISTLSPTRSMPIEFRSSLALFMTLALIEVMMSPPTATWPPSVLPVRLPPLTPAFSAGVPFCTLCTSAPVFTGRFKADSEPSIVSEVSPM